MADSKDNCKVALITGSARRIGAQIAKTLHHDGYHVIIHYRHSSADAKQLVDALNSRRANSAKALQFDLLNLSSLPAFANDVVKAWGRIDVLVNNASSFYATPVGSIEEKDWDVLLGSNLKAPLFLSQALATPLKKNNGCIVNMADIHADRPLNNHAVYSLAKAGLVSLTKSLAKELGPNIRCNAVAPGAILWPETPLEKSQQTEIIQKTALKREGSPEDIAKTVLFLVSQADYMTGQVLAVDGGRTLSN